MLLFQYKYEEALKAFDNALEINKSNPAAWVGRGSALSDMATTARLFRLTI